MSLDKTTTTRDLLESSETYKRYAGECGQCQACGEWTEVLSPCCSTSVSYEGSSCNFEDLTDDIAFETGLSNEEIADLLY